MRQTELSRELAALHDTMVQKRAIEQEESVEETLKNEEKVNRTAEIPQGPEEVMDDPNPQQQRKSPQNEKRASSAEKSTDEQDSTTEIVKDPMLGRNIDISG